MWCVCVCSWIESDRDEGEDFGKVKDAVVDTQSKLPSSFAPKEDRFSFDVSGQTTRNMVDFSRSNKNFQSGFHSGDLPAPPARKIAIVTCMDARMHPEAFLGLRFGDAHVIRNAGGRISEDALRSLVVSQRMLGTEEVVVIHHTKCGKLTSPSSHCHSPHSQVSALVVIHHTLKSQRLLSFTTFSSLSACCHSPHSQYSALVVIHRTQCVQALSLQVTCMQQLDCNRFTCLRCCPKPFEECH